MDLVLEVAILLMLLVYVAGLAAMEVVEVDLKVFNTVNIKK
jgi:hypothetical protein